MTISCVKKELICEQLKAMREKAYPLIKNFTDKTKIQDANVRAIESGVSVPGVERMERWVKACGLSLSQFIARIETIERGKPQPPEHPLVEAVRALVAKDELAADALLEVLKRMGAVPASKSKRR